MLLATDLADYLVRKGVPFRDAHEIVGKAVAESTPPAPLDQLDLAAIDPAFGPDAKMSLPRPRPAARSNPGSPSPDNVKAEIARWRSVIGRRLSHERCFPAGD